MKLQVLVILSAVYISSCAMFESDPDEIINLEPGANFIRLVDFLPSSELVKYNDIEMLGCSLGHNGESLERNIESCENDLKNKALMINAQIVLVKPEYIKRSCNNCCEVKGIAYQLKSIKDETPVNKSKPAFDN